MLTIWWCPCAESSLLLLEEGVFCDQCVLLAKLAFALLHFVLQGQTFLLLQVFLDFLLLHPSPLWRKWHLIMVLALEGVSSKILVLVQNCNSLLNNHQQENIGSHHKKDTLHPKAKKKPQQDGRRGKIIFRIKPVHTRDTQRAQKNKNKNKKKQQLCGHQDPETPQRLSQSCLECWVSPYRSMSQQWPATGTGALTAADLGHTACGISLLGGDRH